MNISKKMIGELGRAAAVLLEAQGGHWRNSGRTDLGLTRGVAASRRIVTGRWTS